MNEHEAPIDPAYPPAEPYPSVLDGAFSADAATTVQTAPDAAADQEVPARPGLFARLKEALFGGTEPAALAEPEPVALDENGDVVLPADASLEQLPRLAGQDARSAYALVSHGLPVPPGGVGYLVEARPEPAGSDDSASAQGPVVSAGSPVQIVGYVDAFGRVFSVGSVQSMPPACEPSLQFMRYADRSPQTGCIEVATARGKTARLAEYLEEPAGQFRIVSPRVNLGIEAAGLSLYAACAVAFLALWLFPRNEGVSLTTVSVKDVLGHLRTNDLFDAVGSVLADVRQAEAHPLLVPPGVVALVGRNLRDAGLSGLKAADLAARGGAPSPFGAPFFPSLPGMPGLSIAGLPVPGMPAAGPMGGGSGVDLAGLVRRALAAAGIAGFSVVGGEGVPGLPGGVPNVRFIRTTGYANTFYVGFDRAQVSPEGALKLLQAETVLNRFLFAVEELDRVGAVQTATFEQAVELDAWLVENIAARAWLYLDDEVEVDRFGVGSVELDVRAAFARGCEKLRLPYRLEYGFRFDAATGDLVVDVECPSSALMPQLVHDGRDAGVRARTYAEREGMASRYALHLLGTVAAVAFWAGGPHGDVACATVNCWHGMGSSAGVDELARYDNGTLRGPVMHEPVCIATATFERAAFFEAFAAPEGRASFERNPFALVEERGVAKLDASWHLEAVAPLRSLDEPVFHPVDSNLPPELDMRMLGEAGSHITHARTVRDLGIYEDGARKAMADEVASAFQEGGVEAALEAVRDVHDRTENLLVRDAALHVSERIAAGRYTAEAKAPIVEAFSDVYGLQRGMKEAQQTLRSDPAEACRQLQELIDYCDEYAYFADTSTRRYRYFDSYASRAVYAVRHPEAADGRELRLCPDEYYLCHYRLASILADSLDHAEDAIAHARRCVELAPTVAASHMRLARCYFSVFDYVSEIEAIKEMLRFAWNPGDLGMALYWLGYAFCMVDKYDVGGACYQLCAFFDPSLAESAISEITDLLRKRDRQPRIMAPAEIEFALRSEGIDPESLMANIEALLVVAGVAADAHAFGLARNLLSAAQLTLRDDALPPVLESLEE